LLPDEVAERLRPPLAGYDLVAHCEVLSSKFWLSILYLQLRTLRRKTFCGERNFGSSAAPEAIPVPLLPSGPGGVRGTSLHRARSSTLRRSRAFGASAEKSLAQRLQPSQKCSASASSILFLKIIDSLTSFARGSGFRLRRCSRGCVRWLHLGWIHPVHFERARAVKLHDGLALAHREMPHFLWHGHKIPHV